MDLSVPERRERTFFVGMAILMAVTVIAGFGNWALHGKVVFPVPWHVHVHGFVFLTWIGIFIAQTVLIRRDQIGYHRLLGRFALFWAVVMVAVGAYTAINAVPLNRVPPVFAPAFFLAMSFLELVTFVTLLCAAILLRKQTAWHRRLMLGATVAVIGPAWGRTFILLGLTRGPFVLGALLAYAVVAMTGDLIIRGKIHPAYYWVVLALVVEVLAVPLLAGTAPFIALAHSLVPH